MQQTATIGRRTLGENGDILALRQNFGYLRIDDARVPPTPAAQEDGLVPGRQTADERSVADLFLGHEGGRQDGVNHQNIKPGNVIRHQQNAGCRMAQVGVQTDAQNFEKPCRPT